MGGEAIGRRVKGAYVDDLNPSTRGMGALRLQKSSGRVLGGR